MAIPMPMVQDIRKLDRQGLSRAQIARRLHVDRGTVAKYADMRDCSPKPKTDRRYDSKIDPYTHLVDSWLEEDRLMPRKQRHTIKRVHERLLAETDYDGEYSTTLRYVHRWREANRSDGDRGRHPRTAETRSRSSRLPVASFWPSIPDSMAGRTVWRTPYSCFPS